MESTMLIRQEEIKRIWEKFFISLESLDMEVKANEVNGVCDVYTPLKEEETIPHDVEITKGTVDNNVPRSVPETVPNVVQGALLSPLDLLLNQRFSNHLTHDLSMSLTMFEGETSMGANKKKQDDESYLLPCSNDQNMSFSCKTDFVLQMVAMEGIKSVLFTPHFHCYMLLRLMKSLNHLDMVFCLFKWRNGVKDHIMVVMLRDLIMVFDPGGICAHPSLRVLLEHMIA